jgi:uncharacterized protein (DUF58 family)
MTLGALNYNNNPALILCFLLASVAHSGLLMGFLGLRGLRLVDVAAAPVHAGEQLQLQLRFDAVEARRRGGLVVHRGDAVGSFDLPDAQPAWLQLAVPTTRRGWLAAGRIELSMRRPLGMFVCWSWLHPDRKLLVYPAPEINAPPLPLAGGDGAPRRQRGPAEEVHGLRDYRAGDPLRSIAWKRSAQQGRTLVREFESPAGHDAVLDWQALSGLSLEQRISRLTSWMLEAERIGCSSELRLPDQRIGPDRGRLHLHSCLQALALLEAAAPRG